MAITLSTKTLVDSKKIAVVQFSGIYLTTTGEESTAVVKVDASALTGGATSTNLKIQRVWFSNTVEQTFLSFDGATDALAFVLPIDTTGFMDYRSMGGLYNTSTTPTGDITLTTLGTALAGDGYSITIEVSKS